MLQRSRFWERIALSTVRDTIFRPASFFPYFFHSTFCSFSLLDAEDSESMDRAWIGPRNVSLMRYRVPYTRRSTILIVGDRALAGISFRADVLILDKRRVLFLPVVQLHRNFYLKSI